MHGGLEVMTTPIIVRVEPEDKIRAELLMAMREILRMAIRTIIALRDPDRRYLGWARMPMHVVHEASEAYGYSSTWVSEWQPSPREISQMERVAPWLAWLRREHGQSALRRLMAWSVGVPKWKIGQRESCSERTVENRIDRSVAAIIRQFADANIPVEYLEEPIERTPFAAIFERATGPVSGEIKLVKIYIGGRGFWRDGKWLKDKPRRGYAAAKAEKLAEAD